jgi:sulfur carrier protein
MKLHINGKESVFSPEDDGGGLSLVALVESLGMKPDRVAVELNRNIVPRDRWPETKLSDGDRLEIVQFVGGG